MIEGVLLLATGLELQCHIYFCFFFCMPWEGCGGGRSALNTAHLISVNLSFSHVKSRESLNLHDIWWLISFDCHCHFLQFCNTTCLMQRNFLTNHEARYRVPTCWPMNSQCHFHVFMITGKNHSESFYIHLYARSAVFFNKRNITIIIVSFFFSLINIWTNTMFTALYPSSSKQQ